VRVSALIPTYNRRAYIFRAIDSIFSQSVSVNEVIVVDDGSTDGTSQAIQEKYGSGVRVVIQKNSGVGEARRRAVEESNGEWIAFLDSDDEWAPGRMAILSDVASSVGSEVAWVFGDSQFVADKGDLTSAFEESKLIVKDGVKVFDRPLSELPWSLEITRPPVLEASLIRKSALMGLQCFSEGLRHGEDFLASLQVASRYSFAAVPAVVTKVYRTSDLTSSSLEYRGISSIDACKAGVIGYELAARTTQSKGWMDLHAEFVRRLCKASAREDLPIRGLAAQQFTFGVSLKSLGFWCAAMLGSGFFRVCFSIKRFLRMIGRQDSEGLVGTQ